MKMSLFAALLMACSAGEASARTPGIAQLSDLIEGRSVDLTPNAKGAVFSSDELGALRGLGFLDQELVPRIESGCYSNIACEVRYRFGRLSDVERGALKAQAATVLNECEYIVFGDGHHSLSRWELLTRLADARERRSILIGGGSVVARIIGIVCVAQADTIAAAKLSKLPDKKLSAILASGNGDRISLLHLVAQHADRRPGFQARVAKLFGGLNCALHSETVRQKCAYLADRVLLAFGRPQMYGTQYDCSLFDRPDVPEIELRRQAVGLEKLNEYQNCPR